VLTSNLGSQFLADAKDGAITKKLRDQVMGEVRLAFRPEFINRLDEIIIFSRLGREHMVGIVDIQLSTLIKRLGERHIALAIDLKAKEWLADAGYEPAYGARPLKRVIQKELQDKLANLLLAGKIADGSNIEVKGWDGGLKITT
jgi:ATP-dependent Clp protease ATP-binding subunit ClpB